MTTVLNVRQLASRVDPGALQPRGVPGPATPPAPGEASFAEALRRASEDAGVTISGHAQERITQRGISLSDDEQRAIGAALDALHAKGARDALLLRSDAAFVVNVPNRTVVTAMDQQELQERIFTQIDSAMLLT